MPDRSVAQRTELTLYDVLAAPVPERLGRGETRTTKAVETSDEEPAAFPGVGIDG